MAPIRIPKRELPSLKKLAEIDQSCFASFISALEAARPTLTPRQFANQISDKVGTIASEDLLTILNTVFALYGMKEKGGGSSEDLADSVSKAAAESKSKDIRFPAEKQALLKDRLKLLLDLDKPLAVTSKALDVMTEHERIFCGARILTDMRPVFTGSPPSPAAAVIIHNLKVGFHQAGEHREFYVALDDSDIQLLKDVIAHAEEKAVALRSLLSKANLPHLEN